MSPKPSVSPTLRSARAPRPRTKASPGPAAAGSVTAGKAADKAPGGITYITSKREAAGPARIRTRAERRAEATQFIAGRDLTALNTKDFKQVRDTLGIQADPKLTGAAARRTHLRQVREFLGPDLGGTPSPSPER